jgi:hypothetical protein
MTRTAIILDSAVFVLAVIVFALSLKSYRRNKRLVGRVQAQWSIRFNLAYPWEWLRWLSLFGLLGLAAALLVLKPAVIDPYGALALVFLVLAFFPRNNFVVVGEAGILDRSVFVPWTAVRERRIVEDRGRRYLEIKAASGREGAAGPIQARRIRIPKNISLVLE